jgi:hypothetical protein
MGRRSISGNGQAHGIDRPAKRPRKASAGSALRRPTRQPTGPSLVYQLKITLRRSKPPIWRRVLVPADTPLDLLHIILQRVMGWTDSHMHDFLIGGDYYGDPTADNVLGFKNECLFTLEGLVPKARQKFLYEYDFGDDWEHEIVVEKITSPEPRETYPKCVAGEGACPPEDCGGIWSYYNMLQVIKDKQHPDFKGTREWLGYDFDADEFSVKAVNKQMADFARPATAKPAR